MDKINQGVSKKLSKDYTKSDKVSEPIIKEKRPKDDKQIAKSSSDRQFFTKEKAPKPLQAEVHNESSSFTEGPPPEIQLINEDSEEKDNSKDTPMADEEQQHTISDYMYQNKMLQMKISKMQSEMNKKVGPPASKEQVEYLQSELDNKDNSIRELEEKVEDLSRENSELKDSVQFQKYLVEEKVEIIKKEQQRVKDVQSSTKGQNAVIEQLKNRIAELEEEKQQREDSDRSANLENSFYKMDSKQGDEETPVDKMNIMGNYRRLEKSLEDKRKEVITLQEENNRLKESVQSEQEARVKQFKDTMELEIRLKSFEDEVTKSQQERYQLALDLDRLSTSQTEMFSKVKESEEILNTCVSFLEKNGLIQTSFLSEDAVLFMND